MIVCNSNGEFCNRRLLQFGYDFVQLANTLTDDQLEKLNEATELPDVSEFDCPFEEWVTRILNYAGIKRDQWWFLRLDPCFSVRIVS